MRILLTGASGFLGKILSRRLSELNHTVIGVGSKGQAYNFDIRKPFVFDADEHFDVVVHAAGKAHSIPRTEEQSKAFFDVNLQGTIHLSQALDRLTSLPKAFVFISTVSVYGVDEGEMISETHPLQGSTPYAKSKILAEEYLKTWTSTNQVKLSILRLPLVVGPNPPGNLGAMIKGMKTGRYLSIGSATARKSMVWADDIADYMEVLSDIGGTYNLTDGHHPSFQELELEISEQLRKRPPIKIPMWSANLLGKVGDLIGNRAPVNSSKVKKLVSSLTFNDNKAQTSIGWKPTKTLRMIKNIIST